MTNLRDKQQIHRACTHFLSGHYPQTPQQVMRGLAETVQPDELPDVYGQGKLLTAFEANIARLLGKEAAVFMPSGTMSQQIAVRIWTDRRHVPRVGYHPTSHLEIHEFQAIQRLHNVQSVLIGSPYRLMTLEDIQAVAEPLGALLLELPQREIGGQLPTWDELTAISAWARERQLPIHMDGARLWECKPYYQHEYAEIAALFDTVYVSFYKILGGIAGSILAGPADVIAEARIWQRRLGGNLFQLYPYALAARKGLAEHLERMDEYHHKAKAIAAALSAIPQIEIMPGLPQTNMMHVFLRGELDVLNEAALTISEETGTWLFGGLTPSQIPAYQKFELSVGDATLDLPETTIVDLFQQLFNRAESKQ
jgi:threonine aldolase